LIDLPAATHPVGVWVADTATYISANIVVQNNLVLGAANPAIRLDVDPSANVAVVGNLSPSAVVHLSGDPALPPLPRQPDVTDFTTGVLATQRIKIFPRLVPPVLADSPPPISNWNPAGIHSCSYVVLQTSSPNGAQLTGIDGGFDGDYLFLVNYGPGSITFTHDDAGSLAANRFYLSGGTAQTIPLYGHISFRYDGTGLNPRWVQIG